jgi:pimeloyl-ACP methyl ester carboxylesterase
VIPQLVGGLLPPGIHDVQVDEVLAAYCSGSATRQAAGLALRDLARALGESGAKYLLIGGSLPTSKSDIHDVDIVAVFARRSSVPSVAPRFSGLNVAVDLQYASEDEGDILDAMAEFFQLDREGRRRGLLRVQLVEAPSRTLAPPKPGLLDLVSAVYLNRYFEQESARRGLLITIHGIMSHAPWNADLTRIASSQGWVVAPFLYGYRTPLLLLSSGKRRKVLDQFREWIHAVAVEQKLPISVVAHSFGTYVAVKYLVGFDVPPYRFNALILTGAILDRDLDWSTRLAGRVGHVLHERAPLDSWVGRMPPVAKLSREALFGNAGVSGFRHKPRFLQERKSEVFNHSNVIRADVIAGRWLPFLNAHSGFLENSRHP